MDTGSIMENQMSDLIDQGIALQDEIVEQALKIYKEHKIMPEQLLEIVNRVRVAEGKNLTEELTNFRIIQNNINEIFLIIDDKYGTSKSTEPEALIIQRVSNRRELLLNFLDWYNEDAEKTPITEDEIDLFIKEKIK